MVDIEMLKSHMYDVVGALHTVHKEMGAGLNENCYQEALVVEFGERGIKFTREQAFHPIYKGHELPVTYRTDFICKNDIVVECKAVSSLNAQLRAQLFNYMRLLNMPCGIIVSFHPKYAEIERYFYDMEGKEIITVNGIVMK